LGTMMLRAGVVSDEQLTAAQNHASSRGTGLVEAVVALGYADQNGIVAFLHSKLMIPRVGASVLQVVDEASLARIPAELAHRYTVLPVSVDDDGNLTIAMADPTDMRAVDAISDHTGAYLVRAVAPIEDLRAAIIGYYGQAPARASEDTRPRDGSPGGPRPAAVIPGVPAIETPAPSVTPQQAAPVATPAIAPPNIAPPAVAPPAVAPPSIAPSVAAAPSVAPATRPAPVIADVPSGPVRTGTGPRVAPPSIEGPRIGPPPGIRPPAALEPPPGIRPPAALEPPPGIRPPAALDPPPGIRPPAALDPTAAQAYSVGAPPDFGTTGRSTGIPVDDDDESGWAPSHDRFERLELDEDARAPTLIEHASPSETLPGQSRQVTTEIRENEAVPSSRQATPDPNAQRAPRKRAPASWNPPQTRLATTVPLSPEAFNRILPRFATVTNRDQVTSLLLDFLADGFDRVIMFTHVQGEIRGRDARGEDLVVEAVRQIRIPSSGPSLFSTVIEHRTPYFGPMRTDTAIDAAFHNALGGVRGNVLVVPVVLRGKVPLLVFASGARHPVDANSLHELTLAVSQAFERLIVAGKARKR
ncbi:MAG: hypothetical protein KC636_22195, partial [Myxococcales bacterium]|nr:hypothetical protein [Myxococcales bacterium]